MEDKQGFVLFYRKIHEWDWYTDSYTFHLFFHCITCANHKPKNWRGIKINRGQFLTGRKKLSVETGLSEQQVRTCLKRLKSTNELTIESTNAYSIITVNNYDLYQPILKNQPTKTQSINQRLTTTNNDNKDISNTSYINISLSNKKITKEEREILRNYLLRQKRKPDNPEAYIKTLIKNGDWVEIVEKEKKRLQAKEEKREKEEKQKQILKQVQNDENDEKEIEQIQKRIRENFKKRRTN
jgi:hypothetical protein